jgi:methylmalonyl-CoA carboxyltransferase 12S subunit
VSSFVTEPDIANVLTIVALIVASLLISYLTAQHALKQARDHAREQLELRLGGLTHAIAELEARVAELTRPPMAPVQPKQPLANAAAQSQAEPDDEVPAEVLILITAAVTSFLGKKVRVRSAKMLQSPYEIVNPWAQQGRVIVQASHNLQVRHR